MAKQLNVSLAFTADTREAKAQLLDLQKQLNNILKTPSNKLGLTDEIREAISATAELSSRLQQATNVNTGNLDFSKFNNSLKQSGQNLSAYGQQLQKLGPAGQQAFLTLTKSVATAEIPIKRTNALIKEFTTTLANTARWQVSSSVLHGLMGSMQSAYRYAQDLNKSLTDIRIVTGQSADQMARFAQQANAAAKQLSATTLEYTNASLIYYQQGLTDQQVKERTDVTIKMANVSRQSAEIVSEQMTAVWNNFYNGSKSLEYYADVMTALGAATASSADEIAGGLEKFAAIGETIGLSYEYAASALATITSNTRQSEEVVGTALKTIFARIQGLNLGETLDDGVTLNKYSAALQKVGISIFDSAGELKKMDNILDEMGSKWETLSKAQQTALAQTVAGTRQYTQLVALMDNWNKGDSDSMKANLSTAYGSTGALQDQADIYAESWEAAQDRVSAAAEKIYSALLNDEFFVDMLNGFEKILTFVSQLIDNLGGLKGVLLTLGAIVTKVFSAQLSQGLTNMAYNLKMMTKSGRESVEKERRDFIDNAVNSIPQSNEYTTDTEAAQQDSLRTELTLQMEYIDNAERMSVIEADTNKKLIERTRILKEHSVELNKRKAEIDDNVSSKTMSLRGAIQLENEANPSGNQIDYEKQVKPLTDQIKTISSIQAVLQDTSNVISAVGQAGEQGSKIMKMFVTDLMSIDTDNMSTEIKTLIAEINQMGDSPDPVLLKEKIEALNFELEKLSQKNVKKIKTFVPKETRDDVDSLTQSFKEQAVVQRELNQTNKESGEAYQAASDGIRGAKGAQKQWSDVMVESANVAFNVASAISMVSSAIDTLKDPDVSGMQKLVTVLSTMGMVLPTIINLIGTMKKLFSSETVAKIANAAATWAQVAAEKKHNEVKGEGSKLTKKSIKETWEDTVWKSTKKENQDKYIEQILKDKGYIRDKKTGGWGKTTVEKNGAKRFDDSTVISNDDAVKMAAPEAQKMAGKGALKALGGKIASAGLIAAGIAVIVGTIAIAVDQVTKAEQAVAKAKVSAQALSENYDNVKASYDNFINAQSGYETATNGLKELTKGTVEYQEALLQANEAASELLATNKNLTYTIENGQIVIDEESLKQAKVDELKRVESAQAAKIAGQRELIEAEENLQKRDVARNLKTDDDIGTHVNNTLAAGGAGAAAGALIGSAIPVIGTAIGAAIGGAIGLISGAITTAVVGNETDVEADALEKLEKAYLEDDTILQKVKDGSMTDEEWKAIGIEDASLIQALEANGKEVAALVGEMAANTAAINAQNDLVAANALADNEAVQNSEYKDQIVDIAGDAYGHAYDKAMESDWVDTWGKKGIAQINGANKEAKKVFEDYLKYAGLEGQGYKLTDTTGNDKNRKFIYEDAEGNEHEVSLEAMQAARAAYEASATLDESATKLAETFTKLADSTNEADQALLSFVSVKNFEDATKGELEDMKEEVGTVEKNEDGTYTQESLDNIKAYLEESLGETLTDDVAIRYGYESADAMIKAFADKMGDADEAWENIADNYSKTVRKSLRKLEEDDSLDNLSLNEVEKFGKALQQAFNTSGQEGIDTLTSMLNEAGEYSDEFANAIDGIDWDSATVNDLEIALENAGVECNFTTEELQNLIDVMSDGTVVFAEAAEIYKNLHGIIDELETGDTVSAEDFTTLKETFGSQMTDYFMQMADGSYKLVGDAEEFYELVNSYTIENFEKTIDNLNQVEEEINNLLNNYDENSIQNKTHSGKWWQFGAQGDSIEGYDKEQAQAQYDFLKNSGYSDEDALAEWREGIENGTITIAQLNAMQKAVEENAGSWDQLTEAQQVNGEQINQAQEALASTATSVGELNDMLATGRIDVEEYNKALESITNTEVESYGLDPEEYQEVAEAIQDMGAAGEEWYEELKDDQEALNEATKDATVRYMRMNDAIEDLYDNYDDYSDALKDVQKAETKADKALAANTETAKKLRSSLAGLLGVTEDLIDADLLDAISPDDLEAAANGDAAAIERIRDAWIELQAAEYMGEDAIAGLKAELDSFNDGAMLDLDTMPFLNSLIQAWVDAGLTADEIENRLSGMNIDADVSPFTQAMADMVNVANEAGSAVVQSTSIKQTAEVVEETTPNTQTGFTETITPHMRTDWAVMPTALGAPLVYQTRVPYYTKSIAFDTESEDIVTPVVGVTSENGAGESGDGGVIIQNAHKSSGNRVSSGNTGKPPVGGDTGGGGGGSKPSVAEKRDTTSQGDVVERYREVNDAIDNVTDALTRAERATSRLWGKAKFDAMREENKILQEQYDLLQQKAEQAEEYAKQDANHLRDVAEEIGVSVVIDQDTGDITNIEEVEKTLYDRLAAAEAAYNQKVDEYNAAVEAAGENPTEAKIKELETMKEALESYEDDIIGGIEDDIDAWEEAEKQLKDSVETWEEAGLEAEAILDEIMQNNFDIWSGELELKIEINERDLELLEYYLSKTEDNVYQMAEAAALMVGSLEGLASGQYGGQLSEYLDNLSIYSTSLDDLNAKLAAGEITEAAYKEGLEQIRSGLLDNLSSLNELDDAMLNYYGDTLSMVTEEIGKYTEKMEHQSSVLEHYGNMMSILGKEQDYNSMGTILQGQVDVLADQLDVAKAEYDLYSQEAANKRKLYEEAVAAGDQAAAEVYKKEWEAADEAAMEAQANMLDKTEEWAESMRAVVENKLAGLAQSLEDALTGGTSFDELTTSLERAASLQEEYLTTTNQIYETNKLMRTAQQEIDKTTNTVAKQRLKDFIKETDQLQDKSKLSQYELEIQQAKYDLLLAEIALEEAQQAKSTVRLQRDAEGNFGYVYTADQDQLANAQQELEDAQNSLYNIGLEGANEYTEKYAQTMQEMYDTLTSIQEAWLNGEIATQEEYDRQMLAAQEYYYQQLEDYSSLYTVAISTDSRVVKDAWSSGFNSMMSKTSEWKDAVNKYSAEARDTLVSWYAKVDEIANKTGLDNIASKVKAVTDESKALKDAVIGEDGKGGVVQALKDELTAVSNLTGGYATLRSTIQGLIADYEALMTTVNNAQNQQASTNQTTENGDGGNNGGDTGGNTGGDTGGNNTGGNTGGTNTGGNTTPTLVEGQDVTVKATATHFSRDGGNGTRMRSFVPGSTYSVMQIQGEEVLIGRNGTATGWVRKTDLVGFNTGGYTGEWGPYGKLAILDEKELVLNKNDTANFLASMELLEHILEIIDLQAASAQLGGLLSSPGYADTPIETIEQNVHIEASFPAVQDRNEIEEAFNTLINRASQYANRK